MLRCHQPFVEFRYVIVNLAQKTLQKYVVGAPTETHMDRHFAAEFDHYILPLCDVASTRRDMTDLRMRVLGGDAETCARIASRMSASGARAAARSLKIHHATLYRWIAASAVLRQAVADARAVRDAE